MAETEVISTEKRFAEAVARAGLITSIAGALITLAVLAGNIYIISLHHSASNLTGDLVRLGPPIIALLGFVGTSSTWYGRWRILRRKERYDVRDDIIDQALNAPGDIGLPGQLGCLTVVNPLLLIFGLILCLVTFAPTPLGFLGNAQNSANQPVTTPTVATALLPTPTSPPTATVPLPTVIPTATPKPTATAIPPTATPIPPTATPTPRVRFAVKPTSSTAYCFYQLSVPLTLDNTGSNIAVGWTVQLNGSSWATPSPTSGTIAAGKSAQLTLTVTNCANIPSNSFVNESGFITLTRGGAGAYDFTATIYGPRFG